MPENLVRRILYPRVSPANTPGFEQWQEAHEREHQEIMLKLNEVIAKVNELESRVEALEP